MPASQATDHDTARSVVVGSRGTRSGIADGLFATGLALLVSYSVWLGRDLTFFSDEWPIIAFHYRGNYLTPYGGHLLLLPIAIYRGLLLTVGFASYTPYRIVGLVCYAALGAILYHYLRGRAQPALAALAALSIVWYSAAQLNVLFPLLLNFSIPLAAMAGVWILLDRDEPRFDLAGGACLGAALACGGVGLVPVAAVTIELAFLRAPFRRWLPFVVPFALWCVWYMKYHTPITNPNSIAGTIRFSLHQVQAAFAGFAGGWNPGGYVLLLGAAVVFLLAILRWHTFNARAAGALAAVGTFAVLTGYAARHGSLPALPADTQRYLWVDAFFVVAALIEVVRPLRIPWAVLVGSAVIVVVGAVTLIGNLRTYNDEVAHYKRTTRTFMVAVEAMPNQVDRHRVMPLSLNIVRAGDYLRAVQYLGSAVEGVTLPDLGIEQERSTADGWMIHDLGLRLVPGYVPSGAACARVAPTAQHDLAVRAGATLLVRAGADPATVLLRRLARRFETSFGHLPSSAVAALRLPADHSSLPWHVRVAGGGASLSVCR